MGFFTRKKNKIITSVNDQLVNGVEVWIVSWDKRHGMYYSDVTRAGKAFLNKDDAKKFINNLEMAQELLQNTHSINIVLEKQE